jgi:branched-chain amino acid transport system ATP-binding protein
MKPSLVVQSLSKHYGGLRALHDVNFSVSAGECVALIGPNGAGKSTCFACIAGQATPDGGQIAWQGKSLLGLSPAERLQAGVGRTFQVAQVFEALSVANNLSLLLTEAKSQVQTAAFKTSFIKTSALKAIDKLSVAQQVRLNELLNLVGLCDAQHKIAHALPYGAKKRLELAMALAAKPSLLLLDEPAAGLAAAERRALMQCIQHLSRQGLAVLYTEHNMDAVFGVADRVMVLIGGELIASGSATEILANTQVRQAYLGSAVHAAPQHASL